MTDYATIDAARQRFETRLLPGVEAALLSVGEAAASLLERGRDPEAAASVEVAADVLAYVYAETVPPFADAALNALRPPIRSTHEVAPDWLAYVRAFLLERAAEMVRSITDTLRDEIRAVLRRGVEEGHGVSRMARDLRDVWPAVARRRAEVIVRTEVLAASNAGSRWGFERTAEEYGIEMELEWLATNDGRVRDSHSAANGQRTAINGTFTIGGYTARYPGDPALPAAERIQCRCAIVAVPVEVKSFLDRRDSEIVAIYEPLKAEMGAFQARLELADRYTISERQVRRILWEGGRS